MKQTNQDRIDAAVDAARISDAEAAAAAKERRKAAKENARCAAIKRLADARSMLAARKFDQKTKVMPDYTYTWQDIDGQAESGGKLSMLDFCGSAVKRTIRTVAGRVASAASIYGGIGGEEGEKAYINIKPDITRLLTACGINDHDRVRGCDYRAVLDSAYLVNAHGDDDAKVSAVLAAVENIACRAIQARDARNAIAERDAEKAAAKAAREREKAAEATAA